MSDPQEQRRQEQEESRRVQQERLQEYQRIQREQGHAAAVAFEEAATQSHRMGLTAQEGLELGRQRAAEQAEGVSKARQQEMLDERQRIQREHGEAAARRFEQAATGSAPFQHAMVPPEQRIEFGRQAAGLQAPPSPTPTEPTPDPEVEFLIREGHTPEDAFILAQARTARREAEARGEQFIAQDLRIDRDTGEVTGTTTFRGVDPLEPESRFPDRFEDERLNIEFVRGQRIGDILIARAAERERAGPIMAYDPEALRDYLESFSRPPVEADFSPEQADAIARARQRGTQLAIERGDIEQDPTMPWATVRAPRPDTPIPETQRIATRVPTGDPIRDAAQAFVDPFINIGKVIAAPIMDLFGGQEVPRRVTDPQTGEVIRETGQPPELAPDLMAATIGAGLEPTGRRIVTPFGIVRIPGEERAETLRQISRETRENPAAAIGAGVAAAGLFFLPIGRAGLVGRASATRVRPRFDYDPRFGSFADRESLRFSPRVPTRSQDPEALAELSRFRAIVDAPKTTFAAPAAVRSFEAAEVVRTKEIRTRGGTLLQQVVEEKPIAIARQPVKFSEPVEIAKAAETVRRTTPQLPRTRTPTATAGISLGFGGATGVETRRARRLRELEFQEQFFTTPPATRQPTTIQRPRAAERLGDITAQRLFTDARPVVRTTPRTTPIMTPRTLDLTLQRTTTRTDPITRPITGQRLRDLQITRAPLRTPTRTPARITRAPPMPPVILPKPPTTPRRERRLPIDPLGPVGIKTKGVRNILFEPLSINDTESKPTKKKGRRKRDMFDISL